jgi:hypothetical protein
MKSIVRLASPQLVLWRGLAQRVAEAALFGSLLLIGWQLTMVRVPARAGSGRR